MRQTGRTPARKERVYIDETKNTYFRLQTPQSITYVDFKDLYVFREGASSISIGSTTPVIQSGDTASITGSLYESGLPVQNATLDVYKNGTKVGTASTGDSGVASYTYTGVADGEVEFQFRYGSISSETYSLHDCWFYDDGVTGNLPAKWQVNTNTANLDRTSGKYTRVSEKTVGNHASMTMTGVSLSEYCVECDILQEDGTQNENILVIYDSSWNVLSVQKGTVGEWKHISVDIEDSSVNSIMTMVTGGSSTALKYKNFEIYPI